MSVGVTSSVAAMAPKASDLSVQVAKPDLSTNVATDTASQSVQPIENTFKVNERTIISQSELKGAIDQLNVALQKRNTNVAFSVDQTTGRDVVRVTNSNTGEVVRQLPFEETLNFMRNLEQMTGLIFDRKA
jgi:flagellar protein FlaG